MAFRILSAIFIVLATTAAILIRNSQRANLSHIPGPFLARYTNLHSALVALRLSRARSGAAVARYSRSLRQEYGLVVRTGPHTVTVLDPRAIQLVYGVKSKLDKSDSYAPFRMNGAETALVCIRDEATHAKYKKLVAGSYAMSSLKGYEPFVDDIIKRWLGTFQKFAENAEVVNISRWSHYFCFDVVSMLTFGEPLGFLEGKDAYNLIKATSAFSWYIGTASHIPWIHKIFQDNFLMRKLSPPPIVIFAESAVKARFSESAEDIKAHSDFLASLMETQSQQPDLMTHDHLVISVVGNLLAGSLSPSSALKELTRYLALHPEAQEKLHEELKGIGVTSPVSFDAVQELLYLEGIIREALRLHPQIVVRLERVVPVGGMNLPNGDHLPPGTKVGALGHAMTLNRDVFGHDADEYKPERWMRKPDESAEVYAERRARMDRTDMTFGQGSRSCIGKNITSLELYKAVASLVLSFSFHVVDDKQSSDTFVIMKRRDGE